MKRLCAIALGITLGGCGKAEVVEQDTVKAPTTCRFGSCADAGGTYDCSLVGSGTETTRTNLRVISVIGGSPQTSGACWYWADTSDDTFPGKYYIQAGSIFCVNNTHYSFRMHGNNETYLDCRQM